MSSQCSSHSGPTWLKAGATSAQLRLYSDTPLEPTLLPMYESQESDRQTSDARASRGPRRAACPVHPRVVLPLWHPPWELPDRWDMSAPLPLTCSQHQSGRSAVQQLRLASSATRPINSMDRDPTPPPPPILRVRDPHLARSRSRHSSSGQAPPPHTPPRTLMELCRTAHSPPCGHYCCQGPARCWLRTTSTCFCCLGFPCSQNGPMLAHSTQQQVQVPGGQDT